MEHDKYKARPDKYRESLLPHVHPHRRRHGRASAEAHSCETRPEVSSLFWFPRRRIHHVPRTCCLTCYSGVVRKKRESPSPGAPVVETSTPDAIIEQARLAIEADRIKKPKGCIICGEESAPISTEGLCWVCRRLKLSAWRDSDSQMTAQE